MTRSYSETEVEQNLEQDASLAQQVDPQGPLTRETPARPTRLLDNESLSPDTRDLLSLGGALTGAHILAKAPAPLSPTSRSGVRPAFEHGKRAFDFAFALCALICILPLLLVSACVIFLESPGPLLFRQRRIGRGGKLFTIYKFRTMVKDGDAVLAQHLKQDPAAAREWAADHKLRKDPRITRVGGFMRRFSIDELPQFLNVLKGDMSVVGPRPIVNAEVPLYGDAFQSYCAVRPGLTGLWQVSGRNDTGYGARVALDQAYVTSCSPKLDASILARTFRAVLAGSGAY